MKEREREREKEKTTKNFETNDQFIFRFSHKSYKKTQKKKKEHKQTSKKIYITKSYVIFSTV